jgi:hypothetical protein
MDVPDRIEDTSHQLSQLSVNLRMTLPRLAHPILSHLCSPSPITMHRVITPLDL